MLFDRLLRRIVHSGYMVKAGHLKAFQYKANLLSNSHAPDEQIQKLQLEKLKRLLQHAGDTTKYYGDVFNALSFQPSKLEKPTDLRRLPILTKEIIANQKKGLKSNLFSANSLSVSYTGGTSGTPSSFFQNHDCITQRIGRQWGILELCGYKIGQRCGLLWGAHQDLPSQSNVLRYRERLRRFGIAREIFDCTIMTEDALQNFYDRLSAFKPDILYGYPNAMKEFTDHIVSKNLPRISIPTIISTAERLSPKTRHILQDQFGAEVFDLYCTREHGCIGFECTVHNGYHIDIGSVLVEIEEGTQETPGCLLVTDLLNFGMPLIRYKIGDLGLLTNEPCVCGCNLPLLKSLQGRVSDTLLRADGSKVAGIMLIDMFLDDPVIDRMQVVQEDINLITLKVVTNQPLSSNDYLRVIAETRKFTGAGTEIQIDVVDEIPTNPQSGKIQEVICKI